MFSESAGEKVKRAATFDRTTRWPEAFLPISIEHLAVSNLLPESSWLSFLLTLVSATAALMFLLLGCSFRSTGSLFSPPPSTQRNGWNWTLAILLCKRSALTTRPWLLLQGLHGYGAYFVKWQNSNYISWQTRHVSEFNEYLAPNSADIIIIR